MRKTRIESMRTRQYLLEAALEVFYRQGVTRSSMQEIAQQAGVTRGALYWHFQNKADLFDALFQHTFGDFLARFSEERLVEVDDAWAYFCENILQIFEKIEQDEFHRKFCIVLEWKCEHSVYNELISELANQYHVKCLKYITNVMALCHQQQRLPKNADLEAATLYLKSSVTGLIRLWSWQPDQFSLVEMAKRSLEANLTVLQSDAFVEKASKKK